MYRQEGSFGSNVRYANEDGPHCAPSGVSQSRGPRRPHSDCLPTKLPAWVVRNKYRGTKRAYRCFPLNRLILGKCKRRCCYPLCSSKAAIDVAPSTYSIDCSGAVPGGPNYKNSYSSNTAMPCIARHTATATAKKSLVVRPAISDILCHGETRITIRWNRARLDEERS